MNNTERLAREWAQSQDPKNLTDAMKAVREHILATTTQATMANLEWDDEKHYLTGAVDCNGNEVIMVGKTKSTIQVCDPDKWPTLELEDPKNLTPNGKRYELREIIESKYPTTLTTYDDFKVAPIGTIITTADDKCAYLKILEDRWIVTGRDTIFDAFGLLMDNPDDPTMFVVRWGRGE